MTTSRRQNATSGDRPLQLPLVLVVPPVSSPWNPPTESKKRSPIVDRLAGMDARMSTSDVVRVVGVNRSTLFRWCKKGLFPPKHISGGWLRSDIEKRFAAKAVQGLVITDSCMNWQTWCARRTALARGKQTG